MHSEVKIKPCNESKKNLHEKVAIVTGSTYGIGFAIARRLAQDGAHVLICSRKQKNVEKAAEQLKDEGLSVYAMQCHVGNKEDRERLVAKALEVYGKIDILVCNAAVNPFVGPIFDTTEDMWTKVFHVNVISTFFMVKLVAPHIAKQGGGSIILCSSFIGYIPHPLIGAYAISKTTLFGLTNVLAQAMRFMNIRVNGLALGLINTNFSKAIMKNPELASLVIPMGVYRSRRRVPPRTSHGSRHDRHGGQQASQRAPDTDVEDGGIDMDTLIKEVQDREVLWNMADRRHADQVITLWLWEELCSVVIENWEELDARDKDHARDRVITQWRSLRDRFKREFNKEMQALSGSAGCRSRYKYARALSFLRSTMVSRRLGEPEECAGIASFLCSEDASYINGENIAVTGGLRGRL